VLGKQVFGAIAPFGKSLLQFGWYRVVNLIVQPRRTGFNYVRVSSLRNPQRRL
jgi:hypothetical protein